MPQNKIEKWGRSQSKAILRRGIINGVIKTDMTPEQVFALNPAEHGKWPWNNWKSNLKNLRDAIGQDRGRMAEDARAYGHDKAIIIQNRVGESVPWHKSACVKFLKKDVDAGKPWEMQPWELWQTRVEYQAYSLICFRNHIYQEIDSRPKRAFRFERKKKGWKYPELHEAHPCLLE